MIRRLLAGLLLVATPLEAQEVDCAALLIPGAAERAIAGTTTAPGSVATVQAGLRAVFGAATVELSDGILGPVSRAHLERLCRAVPLASGTDPVAGAVRLSLEYAALDALAPGWQRRIAEPGFLAAPGSVATARRLLHLAGPPEVKAIAFAPGGEVTLACGSLADAPLPVEPDGRAELEAGLAALLAAEGIGTAPSGEPRSDAGLRADLGEVCRLYPPGTGPALLVQSLRRLGAIDAALPGAAEILRAPAFAEWLAEAPTDRLLRLAGTPPAVVALLRDSGVPPRAVPLPPLTCAPETHDGPVYFALGAGEIEQLTARTAIGETLAPILAARFEAAADLRAAVGTAIGVEPASCLAYLVDRIVADHAEAARVYSLDAAAFGALALDPGLEPVLPALQPIVGLESPSRPQLLVRIEAAIAAVASETAQGEIVAAADAAAAAAEEVEPALDTPLVPVPPERVLEPRTEFAITDPSLLLLRAEVPDPEIFAAIGATEYEQVGSRPVVRARVLEALAPIAATRIAAAIGTGLAAVEPAIVARYRLTPEMIAALSAQPEFAAISPELLNRLAQVRGVAYPNERLFARALDSLVPPLGEAERAALTDIARKRVDPTLRGRISPLAAECGCVPGRYEFDSLVYGFYPFWHFAGEDPAAMPKVDFELVERIVFDGLELGPDARLVYAPRWQEAAATFVTSARRHQARAELGIRLRQGWRDWSPSEIQDAAIAIGEELTRSRRDDPFVPSDGWLGRLDALLDRRPDGVMLIVEGYTGAADEPEARALVALVRALHAELEGTGRTIGLAFDIPLVGGSGPRDPLFADLRPLLSADAEDNKLVEHVVVFVERPTPAAKKLLRARLENTFSGEDRWTVLRHVVPTVPPDGHQALPHEEAVMLASATADSFGQFHDDVLYFQDNFRGVGFWPAPAAAHVLADGTPDRLPAIVRAEFDQSPLPAVLQPWSGQIGAVCTMVCPNRIAFYLACALAGLSIVAVRGLSLYSRRLRSAAEAMLFTPGMTLVLAGLLVLLVTCDRDAQVWAPVALAGLGAAVAGLVAFDWYSRRLDGPVP